MTGPAGVTRWRKKPVVVEMIRWDGSDEAERLIREHGGARKLASGRRVPMEHNGALRIWVAKLQAWMWLEHGDWAAIELGGSGVYPVTEAAREAGYEPAGNEALATLPAPDPVADGLPPGIQEKLDHLAELENAITWDTSCLSCAAVLDSCVRETFRREQAEAKLAAVRAHCQKSSGLEASEVLTILDRQDEEILVSREDLRALLAWARQDGGFQADAAVARLSAAAEMGE